MGAEEYNSPLHSNDNFHNIFNVNSPSEMSHTERAVTTANHTQRKRGGQGQPSQQVQQITIDDISPELAA